MKERSLISYQVFSKLFRHYRRKLRAVILGKGCCNNWVPIMVANIEKAFISQCVPPTHTHNFNRFTSMIGRKFVNFLNERSKG